MPIHSHLPYDHSTSHARVPAGGIHLIASIDSASEAQVTASFFGSTKALHGEVATTTAETSTHNHSNQQYSITAVTTSTGSVAERYAYSAYGEPTILDSSGSVIASSSINNRYSYTGREWDATIGLYHFRARWMSPKTGRFLGRDPIGYLGGTTNLFEYLGSTPSTNTDPTGKCGIYPKGKAECNPGGCETGRGSIDGTIISYVAAATWPYYHYGAALRIKYKHNEDAFRTPQCSCCCGIRFVQRIDEYEYWWDGMKRLDPINFDGFIPPYYPASSGFGSSSNPCNDYHMDNNAALLEDGPGLEYNFMSTQLFGYPRYLKMRGTACAVCSSGPEATKLAWTSYGDGNWEFGVSSLTIYGCMEWEITIEGDPRHGVTVASRSIKEVPCQHAKFLNNPIYSGNTSEYPDF
jgi:RHS repeat-associated protein